MNRRGFFGMIAAGLAAVSASSSNAAETNHEIFPSQQDWFVSHVEYVGENHPTAFVTFNRRTNTLTGPMVTKRAYRKIESHVEISRRMCAQMNEFS